MKASFNKHLHYINISTNYTYYYLAIFTSCQTFLSNHFNCTVALLATDRFTITTSFQMNQILLFTDSRGRRLQKYVHDNHCFTRQQVSVFVQPGATIERLTSSMKQQILKIKNHNSDTNTIFIIMAAGICNFTNKFTHDGGIQIQYLHNQGKTTYINNKLSELYEYMYANNIYFKAVHIPSVSLTLSSDFNLSNGKLKKSFLTQTDFQEQQINLEKDIGDVNSHISSLNLKYGRRSVRWDRDLILFKQKKRGHDGSKKVTHVSMNYKMLYDGVHPNMELSNKWYHFLCKSVELDLQDIEDSSTDSEDDSQSWDFKRHRQNEF